MDKKTVPDDTTPGKERPSTPSNPSKLPKDDTKIIDEIEKKLEQNGGQDAGRDDAFGDMIRKSDRE